jgi:hypothetical protein
MTIPRNISPKLSPILYIDRQNVAERGEEWFAEAVRGRAVVQARR